MVSYIAQLLQSSVAPQVTARLRRELSKVFIGGIVRGYLPQTWWFVSDSGSATFYVEQNGVATVYDGTTGSPDVTVTWTDAAYYAAIGLQDRSRIPADSGAPNVVPHTQRGATAFGQVRKQLGL